MDADLQNRIARRILRTGEAYAREFGSLDTLIECDAFGLTAADFGVVAMRLASDGLVSYSGEGMCVLTRSGLAVASDIGKVEELFPVRGDAKDPLPSELELFGRRPFEAIENPPPPMSWQEYALHLETVWPKLLNSEQQNDEKAYQRFLEKHPCLLPQTYESFGRGATPERPFFFAEPELPGFRAKHPDFMTITWDSEAVFATLIELEAPGKPWATDKGVPSAKLTQALDQLRDWKVWFREPESIMQFTKVYQIPQRILETRQFKQRYILVYGRRSEATKSESFAKKRGLIAQTDEELMTYDRLSPSDRMGECPTLKVDRSKVDSRFSVLHVSPTMMLGPHNAERWVRLRGMSEAIAANSLMTAARRDFLLRRLGYWQSWLDSPRTMPSDFLDSEPWYQE